MKNFQLCFSLNLPLFKELIPIPLVSKLSLVVGFTLVSHIFSLSKSYRISKTSFLLQLVGTACCFEIYSFWNFSIFMSLCSEEEWMSLNNKWIIVYFFRWFFVSGLSIVSFKLLITLLQNNDFLEGRNWTFSSIGYSRHVQKPGHKVSIWYIFIAHSHFQGENAHQIIVL